MRFVPIAHIAAVALALSLPTMPAGAQATQAADSGAIVQLGTAWQNAWNSRDAGALASLLAEDADFDANPARPVARPNQRLKLTARVDCGMNLCQRAAA